MSRALLEQQLACSIQIRLVLRRRAHTDIVDAVSYHKFIVDITLLAVSCRREISAEYINWSILATGGTSTVYLATHKETGQDAAIKVFTENRNSDTLTAAATEYNCAVRSAGAHTLVHNGLALMRGQPALVTDLACMTLSDWIQVCNVTGRCCHVAHALCNENG